MKRKLQLTDKTGAGQYEPANTVMRLFNVMRGGVRNQNFRAYPVELLKRLACDVNLTRFVICSDAGDFDGYEGLNNDVIGYVKSAVVSVKEDEEGEGVLKVEAVLDRDWLKENKINLDDYTIDLCGIATVKSQEIQPDYSLIGFYLCSKKDSASYDKEGKLKSA